VLFRSLTIDTIRAVVTESSTDVRAVLTSGRELYFLGIPVRLESQDGTLALDLRRIRANAALTIE